MTALASLALACAALAATPQDMVARYAGESGSAPVPSKGQRFFTTTHGREWSCSSCHGTVPTGTGRHASTGKTLAPLAPAFNAQRLTDPAKVEKWLRRNCNDVVGRECSAQEKADVLAWLTSLQP